jgi:predicted nucleic acid-binding protein
LGEIFNVLKKKTKLKSREIAEIVTKYSDEFPVIAIDKKYFVKALDIHLKYHYSYYDSLIIATALLSNCAKLYSEDLHHQQVIEDKLTILNPFI